MKKTTFNISFDEDKASALVLYLSQKGATVETELEKALDTLYTKTVPCRHYDRNTLTLPRRLYGNTNKRSVLLPYCSFSAA